MNALRKTAVVLGFLCALPMLVVLLAGPLKLLPKLSSEVVLGCAAAAGVLAVASVLCFAAWGLLRLRRRPST